MSIYHFGPSSVQGEVCRQDNSTVVLQLTLTRISLCLDLKLALVLGIVSLESCVLNSLIGHLTRDNSGCDFVRIYKAMHIHIRRGRNSVFKMVYSCFFFLSLFCVILLVHWNICLRRYTDTQLCLSIVGYLLNKILSEIDLLIFAIFQHHGGSTGKWCYIDGRSSSRGALKTPATVVVAKAVRWQWWQWPAIKTTMQAGSCVVVNDGYWRDADNHGKGGSW